MSADPSPLRARLAEIEAELARLARRHELAMSAFRFDEAKAVQERIAPLEAERASLCRAVPAPAPADRASWPIGGPTFGRGRRPR